MTLLSIREAACFAASVLLVHAFTSKSAFAHHPGGPANAGTSGPINVISAQTLVQGTSVIAVTYEYIGLDALSDSTLVREASHAAESGGHAHVHSLDSISSPALNYAYGLTSDLTVSLRLPYVARTDIREGHFDEHDGEGEVHFAGDSGGIGDLSALAQWRFVNDKATGLAVSALFGVTAPIGSTDETDREGDRFAAEFQPGSGAWDGLFGVAFTRGGGLWSFDASVIYTAVGTGTQDTDLGDRVHYGVAVSYQLTRFEGSPMFHGGKSRGDGNAAHAEAHGGHHPEETASSSGPALDLVLELNGEWQDTQREHGETDHNSGGSILYLSPGLRLTHNRWSVFGSVGIPVVNDLNGVQAEPDWRLMTGLSMGY